MSRLVRWQFARDLLIGGGQPTSEDDEAIVIFEHEIIQFVIKHPDIQALTEFRQLPIATRKAVIAAKMRAAASQ